MSIQQLKQEYPIISFHTSLLSLFLSLATTSCHQSQYARAVAYNHGRLVRDRRTAERHGPSLCVQRVACSVCASSAVTLVTLAPIRSVLSVPSMLRSVVDRITSHLCAYSRQIKSLSAVVGVDVLYVETDIFFV